MFNNHYVTGDYILLGVICFMVLATIPGKEGWKSFLDSISNPFRNT